MKQPKPIPYDDLVAFFQRHLGVLDGYCLDNPSEVEKAARHLAGNLAQIAEVRYK